MKRICLCVGTRPNFIKAAPIIRAFEKHNMPYRFVHTGQHYGISMSDAFFRGLGIPNPDIILQNHHYSKRLWVISETIWALKEDCKEHNPDLIMVLGDVNSSLACAMAAKLMDIEIAHVEAGERCGDNNMVEEINRKLIDSMSDYLFCASEASLDNLIDDGQNLNLTDGAQLHLVGNTMIDQLKHIQPLFKNNPPRECGEPYAVLTLHRAENVDSLEKLKRIWNIIVNVSEKIKVVFPCHPRTAKHLHKLRYGESEQSNIELKPPLPYLHFTTLVNNSKFVMTDSGGLQMETSYLNVPCITLRESTEWLETVSHGTNVVTGIIEEDIINAVKNILKGHWKQSRIKDMPLHDGKAAERIVEVLIKQ